MGTTVESTLQCGTSFTSGMVEVPGSVDLLHIMHVESTLQCGMFFRSGMVEAPGSVDLLHVMHAHRMVPVHLQRQSCCDSERHKWYAPGGTCLVSMAQLWQW